MAHGLAVAAIEREGDTDFLRIVAGDLKTVGAPAQVRSRHSDRAIVPPLAASGMPMKKQTVDAHDAINAFTIGGLAPFDDGPATQHIELLPQHHNLRLKRSTRPEKVDNHPKKQSAPL